MINKRTRNEDLAVEDDGIKKETRVFGIKKFLHSLYKHQNQNIVTKLMLLRKPVFLFHHWMMYAAEDINIPAPTNKLLFKNNFMLASDCHHVCEKF